MNQYGVLRRGEGTNRVPYPACKSAETACLGHRIKPLIIRTDIRLYNLPLPRGGSGAVLSAQARDKAVCPATRVGQGNYCKQGSYEKYRLSCPTAQWDMETIGNNTVKAIRDSKNAIFRKLFSRPSGGTQPKCQCIKAARPTRNFQRAQGPAKTTRPNIMPWTQRCVKTEFRTLVPQAT